MLDNLYTDIIIVKILLSSDSFNGNEYNIPQEIKGCLQSKTKQKTDSNGDLIVTNNLLLTKFKLTEKDIIIIDGKDKAIVGVDTFKNHLTGLLDHYEIIF